MIMDVVFDFPEPVIASIARWRDTILLTSNITGTSGSVNMEPILIPFDLPNTSFSSSTSAFITSVPGGAGVLGICNLSLSPSIVTEPLT